MIKVFIGGSRHVSRLSPAVRQRIDKITAKNFPILVGDANGADKAVQTYLHGKHYKNVQVFCTEGACRNNIGDWDLRTVPADTRERNAQFYSAKDRVMAEEATIGFMVWDGNSVGTLMNALRLLAMQKKVVIYIAPDKAFREFRGRAEWCEFLATCDPDIRRKLEQRATSEKRSTRSDLQTSFLG